MGFFSETIVGYKMADFSSKSKEIGVPRTASSTIQDATLTSSRVPRLDLERLYREDAQTFKLINTYKQLLLQAGYRIVADNKTNQKQYDEFFDNIGKIGMHYKLKQLLDRIIQDCVLYGQAYIERVYDITGTKIVDLKPIDAKLMDYVRDMKYVIMTDIEQNPLGYVMNVGYYSDAVSDKWPSMSRQLPSYIFLRPERIACFILSPYGNGFEGMGLVEPAYKQITRKMRIEESASNAIYNASDNLKYAIVGDAQRSASTQLMNSTLDTLRNWTTNRRAVFPYPTQVGSMPVEQSPQVQEMLKYLRQDEATAGGMSLSMAVGTGESNNKSTMNTERRDFNTKLNAVAYDIATQFTTKILDVLKEVNGYGSHSALIWNNVSVDDRSDMVALLKTLYDMGSISPREARNYAKNVLDLETDEEDYKKFLAESKERLPEMPNQSEGAPLDDGNNINNDMIKPSKSKNPLQVKKNIADSKNKFEDKRQ